MKILLFLSLQFLLISSAVSQWTFESTLPCDSLHCPNINQICVIDSSVSFAFGILHINQNYEFPYFTKRSLNGWNYIQNPDLNSSTRGKSFTATDSSNIWLGTLHPAEIYHSSNGGINWSLQYHVSDTGHVYGITFCKQNPTIGYAITSMGLNGMWNGVRILKTTNGGLNWNTWVFEYYGFAPADNSMTIIDSNFACFGINNVLHGVDKIIITNDGGINWTIIDVEAGFIGPLTIQFSIDKQTAVFVGQTVNTSWFYRTTDGGFNWSIVYTTYDYYSLTMRWLPGTSNIYGNSGFNVVRSIDNGLNWSVMTGLSGAEPQSLDAILINEGTIYALAVTWDRKVYKLLDTVRVIGVENTGTEIPKEFKLYQNYPNPFNPVTTIKYDLPKDGNVTIEIFDVLGRKVAGLAKNEFKIAGSYNVIWDASDFPSGVYFYRLWISSLSGGAGNFVSTKKMVLIK